MDKILGWLTGFSWKVKLAAFLISLSLAFAGGWQAQTIWDGYNENKTKTVQLEKAKEAPGKLIKFNQDIRKTGIEKDACYNAPIPPAALDLLRR